MRAFVYSGLVILALLGQRFTNLQAADLALLVGVEHYDNVSSLQYVSNDISNLSHVLTEYGHYSPRNVQAFSSTSRRPTYAQLREAIPAMFSKATESDTLLFYFSGHGFQSDAERLYLAPQDVDPSKPEETAIAFAWLKEQLDACKAKHKIVLLDCCHAGRTRGKGMNPLKMQYWQPLTAGSGQAGNVVTMASCTAEQTSLVWAEQQQSLFSYWLVNGLKGFADFDGDTHVDFSELYNFVSKHVPSTAERLSHQQEPVREVPSSVIGSPRLQSLQPSPLKTYLADAAELMLNKMAQWQLQQVAVLDFQEDSQAGLQIGGEFGPLGRECAEIVTQRLETLREQSTVPSRRVRKFVVEQQVRADDLGDDDVISRFSKELPPPPTGVLTGKFRSRNGHVLTMDLELLASSAERLISFRIGGTVILDENEWAMLGRSIGSTGSMLESNKPNIASLDQTYAAQPHPLMDPNFPFPVRIRVKTPSGTVERSGEFQNGGKDYVVKFQRGEVFEVWVHNRSRETAMMRMLVDGLNTLPEPSDPANAPFRFDSVAAPVPLGQARAWVLDPRDPRLTNQQDPHWAVRGFVSKSGEVGQLSEFKVMDAPQSAAAHAGFTEQLGYITLAFYTAEADSRGKQIGIGMGNTKPESLPERAGLKPGKLLSVVTVRYVSEE